MHQLYHDNHPLKPKFKTKCGIKLKVIRRGKAVEVFAAKGPGRDEFDCVKEATLIPDLVTCLKCKRVR